MGYDTAFYKAYTDYLKEPTVRAAHDWVFSIARMNPAFQRVVDFGCGQNLEFIDRGMGLLSEFEYLGIDVNAPDYPYTIQADYRTMDLSTLPSTLTGFVSLFSSEITDWPWNNISFYNKVFSDLPNIQAGLVSGFYYSSKRNRYNVEEVGGIVSFQTIERPDFSYKTEPLLYTIKEIVLPVPSKLFGPDVREVWRFFHRKRCE